MAHRKIGVMSVAANAADRRTRVEVLEKAGCEEIFVRSEGRSRSIRRAALKSARPGDTIVCQTLDQLASNLVELVRFLADAAASKVVVSELSSGLSTAKPGVSQAFIAIAEAAGSYASARTKAALVGAKDRGVALGRAPLLGPEKWPEISKSLETESAAAVARSLGMSRQSLHSYINRMRAS